MKTKRRLLTIVAVALVTLASATGTYKMSIHSLNADQIIVTVLDKNEFRFEISIYSNQGDIVYYKLSENPLFTYQKIFDVKHLENGDYKMVLKANGSTVEKDFTVATNKIYLGESELSIDPYFLFEGDELKISYLNFKQEKCKMEIYGEDNLIFKTNIGDRFPITAGFNLSKLEPGNYNVVLSSGNKEYSYQFKK